MREKRRYIVFRVHSADKVQYHSLKSAVEESLLEFLGERGLALAKPTLIKNLWTGHTGFLRTNPKFVDSVKVALALIHQIADQPVTFQTLKVSGTIKSGKSALKAK